MGLKIDRYQLELDIKPNKSQQELQALNVQLTEANKKLTQLGNERDRISEQIKKENTKDFDSIDYKKLETLKNRLEEVSVEYHNQITVVKKARVAMDSQLETIGITGMTLRQLTERQKELNFAVRNLAPDGKNFNDYSLKLQEVNARIKELKGYQNELNARADLSKAIRQADMWGVVLGADCISISQLTELQKNLNLIITNLNPTTKAYAKYRAELDSVNGKLKEISETNAANEETQRINNTRIALDRYIKKMDVEKMTINDLTKTQKELNSVMGSVTPGTAAFNKYKNQLDIVNSKLKELKDSDAFDAQTREINRATAAVKENGGALKIEEMTISELTRRQKDLNLVIENLAPSHASFEKYKAQLNEVGARMKSLKGTAIETKGSLQGLAEGFNKYAAMGASIMAALAGMGISAGKSVQDFADMKEAESQVVKYTNLTKAEVEDLNEEFKKMDTRTSREELNKLAGDAGKLGIDGKKNILDFVDAGNQIKIALGEDLGQDAITNIGKIASMFGDDKKLGLKQAMLASGSAINQLGQDSSATEAYILDFTYRLAGAGKVANMTQTEIMGLASALEQNGQEVETSSTAISQLLIKMYQDPSKFAKLAGIDVKEFIHLLSTNGNEALLKFTSAMSSKGGLMGIAPMFEKMNLDGSRSVGVLSTIAKNVDKVRAAQKDAADAYAAATSVTKEYNKQNSTVQAELDKAKKGLLESSVALGEKLEPAMKLSIQSTSGLIDGIVEFIKILGKCSGTLISAGVAFGIYEIAINLNIIKTKALAFWNDVLKVSFNKLKIAMMENPWGFAIVAVGALVGLIIDLTRKTDELSLAARTMAKIESDANEKIAGQEALVKNLSTIIHDNNAKMSERVNAINILKSIVPDYTVQISKEGKAYDENTVALKNYIDQLKEKAIIEGSKQALTDLGKQRADELLNIEKLRKSLQDLEKEQKKYPQVGLTVANGMGSYVSGQIVQVKQAISDSKNNVKEIDESLKSVSKEMAKHTINAINNTTGNGEKTKKQIAEEAKKAAEEAEKAVKKAEEAARKAGTDAAKKAAEEKVEIAKKTAETARKTAKTAKKAADEEEEAARKAAAEKAAKEKEEKDAKAEAARNKAIAKAEKAEKVGYDRNIAELKSSLSKGEMTQEEYHEKAYQEEIAHLARILKIKKDHGANSTSIEETNNKLIDAMTNEANYQKEKKEKDLNSEIAMLDDAHNADLISLAKDRLNGTITTEEEYQRKMKESDMDYYQQKKTIQEKYGKDSQDIDKQINDILLQNQKDAEDKKKAADEKAKEERKNAAQKAFDDENDIEKKSLINQSMYDNGLIEYEDYQKNKTKITELEAQNRTDIENAALQTFSNMASSASQLYQSMQSKETSKVESKYSKLIKAAQKAGKDTTKLEEQEEAEKLAIKKKYADKEFQMTVLSVIAKTAESIMDITAHWAHNPIVESILIAGAVAEGAVQLAVAKNTRDEAAGLYKGGYSDGYTGTGNSRDVAGVIPVHKNEFVANHKAVGNPAVRQFLDVFNASQKDGTISMMNTTDILDKVRITGGKYDGGYTGGGNTGGSNTQSVNTGSDGIDVTNKELLECLIQIMGYTKATAEKDTVTIRDIKKKIQHIDTLEKNASR